MRKTITIGDKEYHFKTSAAVPRMYRLKFKRDIFTDLKFIDKSIKSQEKRNKEREEFAKINGQTLDPDEMESDLPVDAITTFENIAFIMHKHGDPSQPNDIDEWIEQFETFNIYQIFPELLSMWADENKQLSEPKKETEK